jgi:uncharacterized membrane protein HdeD (DUF308 family)
MSERSIRSGSAYLFTGILLIGFGLVVLFSPAATGGLVVKVTALVLIIIGIVRLAHAFRSQGKLDTILSTLLGALIAGLGVLVWLNPDLGSGFLTLLLTIFFLAHGVWKMIIAFDYRRYAVWGWLLLSGLVSLVFAWLMWQQWPVSGAWAIGILLGLDLLFTGGVTAMLGLAMKRARRSTSVDTISL